VSHPAARVVCVVVTHRRPETLARCLTAIARQSRRPDHLVVVDNQPDARTRRALEGSGMPHSYLPSDTNLGGAAGFAYGILHARALGADWVWLADDDGWPAGPRTLATLLRCAEDKRLGAVSPLVVDDEHPERLAFPLRLGLSWMRTRSDLGARRFLPSVAQLFNGALLSAAAIDAVGTPDPRLFLRGDEVEVHRRLVRSGVRFGTCVLAGYRHPSGASDFVPILGGRVPVYVPADRDRAARAFRNQGYLTSQPGMRWRRWPDVARYGWYYLAHQRDLAGWRRWRARSAEGRREQFVA
jgi:rhamnopyranosyl-N-acetylglucosaminyl-diphospho-decaprenol beta-1,3/1,4-galactofuranosyltransferase